MGTDRQRDLAKRARAGDNAAFQLLLLAQHKRIMGLIRKHLPASLSAIVDPADVMQDVLRAACARRDSFEPRGDDAAYRWLAEIAMNQIRNLVRAHETAKRGGGWTRLTEGDDESAVRPFLDQLASHRRTPSASAAAHELMLLTERLLAELPADQREVIERRYLAGQSVQDVAGAMGRSDAAVKMLCSRGLASLRQALLVATKGV